ncbi:MAG: membrane protein insertase YidC [Verrucomicrobia bacterium]|nr:membrane protein insertase YidC [Verrucomicrobiota bacterium]
MDKKNTIIGVALIAAAFAFMLLQPKPTPPPAKPADTTPAAAAAGTPAATAAAAPTAGATAPAATPATTAAAPGATVASGTFATAARDTAGASVTSLVNDFIEVRFTDFGGAVRDVALKKHPAHLGNPAPYVFNELHADPLLAFVEFPGLDRGTRYERISATATEVVYRAVFNNRLEVTRRYTLAPNTSDKTDPYQLRHETTVRNLSAENLAPMQVKLAVGTAAPVDANDTGVQLTAGASHNGNQTFVARSDLEHSGGFFGIGSHEARPVMTTPGPVSWAAVKNQFFTSILTPDEPGSGIVSRRVKLTDALPPETPNAYGISTALQVEVKALAPQAEARLASSLYVGPKEYRRLSNSDVFKADQDKIMQFGFFKFFSQILLTLMTWFHSWTSNWGVAIILTTLALKLVFVPFTLAASRSAKRMQKIQPELTAIREKYKDNPQKQQQATMELFKEKKINPLGGCFPILITIPFFMGFFTMLQSTSELRFAPFLWAPDLAATDTVGHLFGLAWLPINIMPVLMGATMVIQMRLTPSPSVDNAQATMMKVMPYVFTLFCYSFSCALSLYSFVNGLFTIGQQLVINKMKDPGEAPAVAVGPGGKIVKNVTPKK